ncbi:MAG: hypothetical protein JWQ76_5455 [Ramlibacter sp.]|nr:hypothetical protein [Ramlibacter sp.]
MHVGAWTGRDASAEKAGQQQELQQQQGAKRGAAHRLQAPRQQHRQEDHRDEDRNRQQLREIALSPAGETRGQDRQVAGDVSGEQPVEAEEADDVRASCRDAQHDQERLNRARIVD